MPTAIWQAAVISVTEGYFFASVTATTTTVGTEVDPKQEAQVLFALASGLGSSVALYGMSPADAHRTLHYYLDRVTPASPPS